MLRALIDGERGRPGVRRCDRYWCAADRPATGDDFAVAPVYDGTKVPDDARCEECGIGIAELQEALRDLGAGRG